MLFISYYFPPCSNSGSHRVLRLASEIKRYNWESIILTVKDGYWGRNPRIDYDLINSFKGKVYRSKVFYPCKHSGNSLIARLIRRIWSEITFPDNKITWVITAAFKAFNLVKKEKIDCVFITGAPYSTFVIGYILKRTFNIPVCIDYRDPWTGCEYYIKRKWKHYLCKQLERLIISKVDKVYTVTPRMTEYVKENNVLEEIDREKFGVLLYSFSSEDYRTKDRNILSLTNFTMTFAGNSFGVGDPKPLLKAILEIKRRRREVYERLLFVSIGNLMDKYLKWIDNNEMEEKIRILDYMPYKRALAYMQNSDVLLLPYNMNEHMKLCLPVKIYDYLAIQKPILYYGPRGQVWETINDTKTGYCRLPNDIDGIVNDICAIHDDYYIGGKTLEPDFDALNVYRTDNVIKHFVTDVESLIS